MDIAVIGWGEGGVGERLVIAQNNVADEAHPIR